MPSFQDFNFTGDDPGPDTDPTPEGNLFDWNTYLDENFEQDIGPDGIEDDATNYREPGVGDSFLGQDPTVFAAEGDPDEPTAQTSDVPPIETEQQTAEENPDPRMLGEKDDPEAQEAIGDNQEGDVEDDDSDPALIKQAEDDVDPTEEIRHPEQGFEDSETTVTVYPEDYQPWDNRPAEPSAKQDIPKEVMQDLIDSAQELARSFERIIAELDDMRPIGDLPNFAADWNILGHFDLIGSLQSGETELGDQLDGFEDEVDASQLISALVDNEDGDIDEALDLVLSPTDLGDMVDVDGLIDNDTFLTEFQANNADTI